MPGSVYFDWLPRVLFFARAALPYLMMVVGVAFLMMYGNGPRVLSLRQWLWDGGEYWLRAYKDPDFRRRYLGKIDRVLARLEPRARRSYATGGLELRMSVYPIVLGGGLFVVGMLTRMVDNVPPAFRHGMAWHDIAALVLTFVVSAAFILYVRDNRVYSLMRCLDVKERIQEMDGPSDAWVESCQKLVRLFPDDNFFRWRLINSLVGAGRTDETRAALGELCDRLSARHHDGWLSLTFATAMRLDDIERAKSEVARTEQVALAQDPTEDDDRSPYLPLCRAAIHVREGDQGAAQAVLEQTVRDFGWQWSFAIVEGNKEFTELLRFSWDWFGRIRPAAEEPSGEPGV